MAGRLYPSDRTAETAIETAISTMLAAFAKQDKTTNPEGVMTRGKAVRILTAAILRISRRGYQAAA